MSRADNWTPEMKAQRSAEMKLRWQDPLYRAKTVELAKAAVQSPENRERARNSHLGHKHSEETKRKIGEAHRGKKVTPESIEKRLKKTRGRKLDPEHKTKLLSAVREYWSEPKNRERASKAHRGKKHTEEEKQKIAKANSGKVVSIETRQKLAEYVGPRASNWRGGTSFEPYCPKFNNAFKEYVRNRFNRSCFICGSIENGKRHHVHHIDYNKISICNGQSWAFVPLCNSCHTKTCFNRWYWFNLLIHYWAINPDISIDTLCSCTPIVAVK